MPNTPNQGGGMFARYAGMNMSPIPAGYMESVAQEANMYSNMGSNIANMLMKDTEFKLKEKETEAARVSAEAAKVKAGADDKKADNDREKIRSDSTNALLTARGGILKETSASLNNEYQMLQARLNAHNEQKTVLTPADLDALKSRQAQILLDLQNTNKGFQDFLNKMNELGSPQAQAPEQPDLGPTYRDPAKNRTARALGAVPFNSAPSAASGAEGGEPEYPVAQITEEEAKLQFPQTTTPEPTPSATAPVEQSSKVEFTSFLNVPALLDPKSKITRNFTDKEGKQFTAPVLGKIVSRKSADGTAMSPIIELSGDTFKFDESGNLALSDAYSKLPKQEQEKILSRARMFHIMSWAMSNHPGLLSRIQPTKEEAAMAIEGYINEDNKSDLITIQRAFAWASRDRTNAPMSWEQGELDAAFVNAFQVPTNDFVELGADMHTLSGSNVIAEQAAAAEARFVASSSKVDALIKKRADLVGSTVTTNPYTDKLYKAQEAVASKLRLADGVGGDIGKDLRADVNAAMTNLEAIKAAHTAWDNENGPTSVKAKADALTREIEEQKNQLAVVQALQGVSESNAKAVDRMNEKFSTWVGINPDDKETHWGYVAKIVKNFKGFPTTVNGKPAKYSISEFRNWAIRNPANEGKVSSVQAQYSGQTPSLKSLTDSDAHGGIAKANIGMRSLAPQINQLFGLFSKLNKKYGPTRVVDSLTDPEYAGAQPLRAGLISLIRTAFIGGGNPSNFEQEILRETVPDPGAAFTITEFNLNRMRGLALIVMMNHARTMEANGLVMTQDSLDAYNANFGKILGRKLTMDDFQFFRGMTNRENEVMQNMTPEQRRTYVGGRGKATFDAIVSGANERFGNLEK